MLPSKWHLCGGLHRAQHRCITTPEANIEVNSLDSGVARASDWLQGLAPTLAEPLAGYAEAGSAGRTVSSTLAVGSAFCSCHPSQITPLLSSTGRSVLNWYSNRRSRRAPRSCPVAQYVALCGHAVARALGDN